MSRSVALVLGAWLLMGLISACSGDRPPGGSTTIRWEIAFDTPAHALATRRLEVEVRRGSCTGELVWGPETITRTSTTVMPPGMIAAGTYCLRATATDAGCVRFASAELLQDLRAGTSTISLVLAPIDVERECPSYECSGGTCMPGIVDAGRDAPPDFGIIDIPDFGIVFPDTGPRPDTGPPDVFPDPPAGCIARSGQVSAGAAHTCARIPDGRTFCWGADDAGQLGLGAITGESRVPQPVAGGHAFTSIAAGGAHTCAIEMQQVFCWGDGTHGQLGSDVVSAPTPTRVPSAERFSSVVAGRAHSCAIRFDGGTTEVWCWGANDQGQLGAGAGPDRPTPARVTVLGTRTPQTLAAGDDFTCAAATDPVTSVTDVICWGASGPWLGGGPAAPVAVPAGGFVSQLAAGARHACAIHVDGTTFLATLYCWGEGTSGELGNGSAITSPTPLAATFMPAAFVGNMAAGSGWTCSTEMVPTEGLARLVCFGDGSTGATGPRGTAGADLAPAQVLYPSSGAEAGAAHACALAATGELVCWGDNGRGQLGTGRGAALDRAPGRVCF